MDPTVGRKLAMSGLITGEQHMRSGSVAYFLASHLSALVNLIR